MKYVDWYENENILYTKDGKVISVLNLASEENDEVKAIKECIEKGILADYLKRKGSEVENMLIAEYSYEEDMQVKQEEAMQQGMILSGEIFRKVKKNPKFTNRQIAEEVGCSEKDVRNVKKIFGI